MLQTLWGITAPSLQTYSNETTSNKQTQTHAKWKWGTLASSERAEYWFNWGNLVTIDGAVLRSCPNHAPTLTQACTVPQSCPNLACPNHAPAIPQPCPKLFKLLPQPCPNHALVDYHITVMMCLNKNGYSGLWLCVHMAVGCGRLLYFSYILLSGSIFAIMLS